MVQLPPNLGGVSGSTCYLTISSKLPTSRLIELAATHPLLSPSVCSLSEIHTIATESIPKLLHVLSKSLPQFLQERCDNPNTKPVKLIVIDALAELFHSAHKTTTATLVERSRNISELSALLHALASKYQTAVLVLNEVVDVFDQNSTGHTNDGSHLEYRDQAQWFNRADSIPGENKKEASLGLVWANQVNVRIMLTRTGRRRYLGELAGRITKQKRVDSPSHSALNASSDIQTATTEHQPTLIRRLSVIFSSICLPVSLDYVVTQEGVSAIPGDISHSSDNPREASAMQRSPVASVPDSAKSIAISPLDAGSVHDNIASTADLVEDPGAGDDDWEAYWKEDNSLEQMYNIVDLDLLLDPNITTDL
jgi:DNA repair protein RAD57